MGGTPGPMAIFLETSLYLLSPRTPTSLTDPVKGLEVDAKV